MDNGERDTEKNEDMWDMTRKRGRWEEADANMEEAVNTTSRRGGGE